MPQWKLRTCVAASFLRSFFDYIEITGDQGAKLPTREKAKDRLALVQPGEAELYSGILASPTIKPAPLIGLWDPNATAQPTADKHRVVLHFPGGGFTYAYDPYESSQGVSQIMKHMRGYRTLFAQNRLATVPNGRFPAAIQDALTFYNHVLRSGVEPQDIVLLGDSAGGNLVMALLRYLETSHKLPLPGAAMLWSPWVNITEDVPRQYAGSRNLGVDYVTTSVLQVGAQKYIPEGGITTDIAPFLSPLQYPFKTNIPIFVHAGTAEVFYDEVQRFVDAMSEIEGNRVKFHPTEFAPHDILLSHALVGFTEQAEVAMKDAADYLHLVST